MLEAVRQAFLRCTEHCEEAQGQDSENFWCDLKIFARNDYRLVIPVHPTLCPHGKKELRSKEISSDSLFRTVTKTVDAFIYRLQSDKDNKSYQDPGTMMRLVFIMETGCSLSSKWLVLQWRQAIFSVMYGLKAKRKSRSKHKNRAPSIVQIPLNIFMRQF